MQALLRTPNAPWLFTAMTVFGVAVFGFAIGALMTEPGAVLGERLPELTCLQVAFTADRYAQVFLGFSPQQQAAILRLLVPGDVVFAWGYGFMLAGLTGLLAIRLPGRWLYYGAIVMWAPLAASTLDCIEDTFLYALAAQLLDDPATVIGPTLPLLAGLAATFKYIALAVVTPAYGVAGIIKGWSVDRSVGALFLYVILGLLLFSMILRPLQQVPPCF